MSTNDSHPHRKRLVLIFLLLLALVWLCPRKLSWLAPGPTGDVTGYVKRTLFADGGAYSPSDQNLDRLQAVLEDTWVLWWGVSSSIPMEEEDELLWLEIYTGENTPAATFLLAPDGTLYHGNLRYRPLNADLWEALAPLELQSGHVDAGS